MHGRCRVTSKFATSNWSSPCTRKAISRKQQNGSVSLNRHSANDCAWSSDMYKQNYLQEGLKALLSLGSGRSFVERAQVSIQAYYQGVHEAQEAKHSEHHKLRIGVSAFLSPHLVELIHSTELRLYRNLSIEILTAYSFEILAQLQHRQIDLALITSPPQSASVTSVLVMIDPFMIVVRPSHPLAEKKTVQLCEVGKYPWVYFHRNVHPSLHDLILQRMEAQQQRPNIVHHISQADQTVALLTANSLLAWLTPAGAERVARGELTLIPLLDEHIRLEIHLATLVSNESRLVSEFVRKFMKRIEEERPPAQLRLPIK